MQINEDRDSSLLDYQAEFKTSKMLQEEESHETRKITKNLCCYSCNESLSSDDRRP